MSLLGLFNKNERAELRKVVETNIPQYKGLIPDHTNHTIKIMEALKADRINQIPYETFANLVQENPKYAIRVSMDKSVEGTNHPTLRLLGGASFNPEHEIFINTISGELNGKKVEPVEEQTLDYVIEYTQEFQEAKHKQEKSIIPENQPSTQETDATQESEPKSIF